MLKKCIPALLFLFGLACVLAQPLPCRAQQQPASANPSTAQQSQADSATAAQADPPDGAPEQPQAEGAEKPAEGLPQKFNFHVQYTLVGMGYPSFSAKYTNPDYRTMGTGSTLPTQGQARETQSIDMYYGYRLGWDTELHIDGLIWQGFGLNNTFGINDFPNGEGFKVGVRYPNFSIARFFLQKTINLDGKRQELVDDDQLSLRGKQDTNRITITLGRFSAKDIFDNNSYANNPRQQFMNWALMANAAWDYPADPLGFTTGIAIEWNKPKWTLRYGWFQMSKLRNQFTAEGAYLTIPAEDDGSGDGKIFQDWAMVTELEHRHSIGNHPGAVRLLAYDDHANIGSYKAAVALANSPAILAIYGTPAKFLASDNGVTGGIDSTRALRNTWGFGLNMEQEITRNIGAFSRIGWNCGQNEAWEFTDANWTATVGVSIKGEKWKHPDDVIGAAFIASGISQANQDFLAAGGVGILTGDGALNYGPEKNVELYYDHKLSKHFRSAVDYQFVDDPAFNKDRGPIPGIFALRLHFEH